MNLSDFRQQYPQYNDLSDTQLAEGLYKKFYSDIPRTDFYRQVGLVGAQKRSLGQMATDLTGASRTIQSPANQMATDLMNVLPAAEQRTTSLMSAQNKNLLSADTYFGDDGAISYKDAQGNVVPTDQSKHVVLRDPSDGRIKVYARSPDTEAGDLESAAKVMMGGMMAGAPTARAAIPAAAALKPPTPLVKAATDLGVDIPKYLASDSMAVQRGASALRNIPGAGDPLVSAATKATTQMGDKAAEVAAGYGGGTPLGSGQSAKEGISNWITTTSKANTRALYDKVDELVDPAIKVPMRNTLETSFNIEGRRSAAGLGRGGAVQEVSEAMYRPEGLTYEGLKTLRTNVGEMVDQGILPAGVSGGELKQIYGALTKDLREAVRVAGGGRASELFERANTHARLVADRREALAKVVGFKGDAAPEQVFDRLAAMAGSTARADLTRLAQARKAMGPESWDQFVSGIVERLGRPAAAGPERLDAGFSPERFLTAYNKLSPSARSLLFRSTGKGNLADHLDSIATVSARWKELQKFGNPSGTAQSVFGGGIGVGLFSEPLTTIASVVGGRTLAYLLSRPATAASVARWSRSYDQLARNPSAPRLAALDVATRNLISALPDKGSLTVNDFFKAIQGPVKAPAENEQQ